MTAYLDFEGLTHFKEKYDSELSVIFVKASDLDSIIDNKLITVYTYKGTVTSVDQLPQSNNKVGDVYDVNNGMNYAWDGNKWDALGENKITVDAALSDTSVNPVQNKTIKVELDKKAGTAVATDTVNGLMSFEDKKKLSGLEVVTPISDSQIDQLFIEKAAITSSQIDDIVTSQ